MLVPSADTLVPSADTLVPSDDSHAPSADTHAPSLELTHMCQALTHMCQALTHMCQALTHMFGTQIYLGTSSVQCSFRINNDFSFDDEISDAFGCKVLAFDPSMGKGMVEISRKNCFWVDQLVAVEM